MSESANEDLVPVAGDGWSYVLCLPDRSTDYIQGRIAETGKPYEFDMLQDMSSRLKRGSRVVDVGSNVGNHTIFLAAIAGCRVLAFEPNERLCDALRFSAKANSVEDLVRIEQVGVGATSARGEFNQLNQENLGAQSIAVSADEGDFDIVCLDDVIHEDHIDAIKIDVEGMELEVLQGARRVITRFRPLLYVECRDEVQFRSVQMFVSSLGYRFVDTFNVTLTHCFQHEETPSAERRLDDLLYREVINQYRYGRNIEDLRTTLYEARLKYRSANEKIAVLQHQLDEVQEQNRAFANDSDFNQLGASDLDSLAEQLLVNIGRTIESATGSLASTSQFEAYLQRIEKMFVSVVENAHAQEDVASYVGEVFDRVDKRLSELAINTMTKARQDQSLVDVLARHETLLSSMEQSVRNISVPELRDGDLESSATFTSLSLALLSESIRAGLISEGLAKAEEELDRLQRSRLLRLGEQVRTIFRKPSIERMGRDGLLRGRRAVELVPSSIVTDSDAVAVKVEGGRIRVAFSNEFAGISVWLEGLSPADVVTRPAIFLGIESELVGERLASSWRRNRHKEYYQYLPTRGEVLRLPMPERSDHSFITLEVRSGVSSKSLPRNAVLKLRPEGRNRVVDSSRAVDGSHEDVRVDTSSRERPNQTIFRRNADLRSEQSAKTDELGYALLEDCWSQFSAVPVSPDWIYQIRLPCKSSEPHEHAGVLAVGFLGDSGDALDGPYPGWHNSARYGPYRYFSTSSKDDDFVFRFRPPNRAAFVHLTLHKWKAEGVKFLPPSISAHCASPEQQMAQSEKNLDRLLNEWAKGEEPLVVLSTTTKPIGEKHRANRPMQFATEYAAQGAWVVYVYYRFSQEDPVPTPNSERLLQIPNDHFHRLASLIAFFDGGGARYYLSSIPDYHSVYECCLFESADWRVIYEARDDWEEFQNSGVGNWYHSLFERYLALQAMLVTAVSPPLLKKLKVFGAAEERCHVIPNGAGQAFIQQGPSERIRRKARGPSRRIGYFGHLTEKWFDWRLLISAAAVRPEYQFEIIGFGAPSNLQLPANIALHEGMEHEDLIRNAREWEVGLIPFKPSILSSGVDPIKAHEYIALGLKCVAIAMPQMVDYPVTFTYQRRERFVSKLDEAMEYKLTEADWAAIDAHMTYATWSVRANQTLELAKRVGA